MQKKKWVGKKGKKENNEFEEKKNNIFCLDKEQHVYLLIDIDDLVHR